MSKVMRAIGLMSGTSLDGIDVAYLETDGEDDVTRGPALTFPYDDRHAPDASDDGHSRCQPAHVARRAAGVAIARRTRIDRAPRVRCGQFLRKSGIERTAVDVIGFHGQTVLHKPEAGLTVQLGRGDMLANVTRCPVIYDLRAADVDAGGQGAPLVPAYHRAVTAKLPTAAARHRQHRRRCERHVDRPRTAI